MEFRCKIQKIRMKENKECYCYQNEDIKKVFTMKDAIEADKQAFQLVVEGKCESPLRINIQAPETGWVFSFYASLCRRDGNRIFEKRKYFPT